MKISSLEGTGDSACFQPERLHATPRVMQLFGILDYINGQMIFIDYNKITTPPCSLGWSKARRLWFDHASSCWGCLVSQIAAAFTVGRPGWQRVRWIEDGMVKIPGSFRSRVWCWNFEEWGMGVSRGDAGCGWKVSKDYWLAEPCVCAAADCHPEYPSSQGIAKERYMFQKKYSHTIMKFIMSDYNISSQMRHIFT